MKIKVNSAVTYTVHAFRDGKLLEEKTVETLEEAERIAKEFSTKYGEYTTSIKFNW